MQSSLWAIVCSTLIAIRRHIVELKPLTFTHSGAPQIAIMDENDE